ncbi:MAG TPA: 50S ribosomal protein L11 methyltransferase [Hyphomonadaceae bacterium]|jgi:predicted nicotinamide N-methyase|nr:50S ribosomal protein L11 methyltransferase [Hyphomonadaceae bacterium]
MAQKPMENARAFIRANLRLEPAPAVPEIRLYRPHPASGLGRFVGDDAPPYWAHTWAGGTVLARHILDHPDTVRGRHILDLGCGSGIVAIAAALSGAASVTAADIDPNAIAASELNAQANGATLATLHADLLDGPAPACDLILAGDTFYDPALAQRVTTALDRWNIPALVGDMGRTPLPVDRLEPIASYNVPDFGQPAPIPATIFRFRPLD